MTDYAQGALGDVVFAQLPEPDSELNQMGISVLILQWNQQFLESVFSISQMTVEP